MPLGWLQTTNLFPQCVWRERDSVTLWMGAGASSALGEAQFGGTYFSSDPIPRNDPWSHFPSSFFFSPLHERQCLSLETEIQPLPRCIERTDMPTWPIWKRQVEEALQTIDRGLYKKVVLARRTSLRLSAPTTAYDLLPYLERSTPSTTLFALIQRPDLAWLGLSPEFLYRRTGNLLRTDAVAGTLPGQVELADFSSKEREELFWVTQHLQERLPLLCSSFELCNATPRVLHAGRVSHLHQELRGEIIEGIRDDQILRTLHPTPAVSGYPVEASCTWMRERELFSRGWYAAPIGWRSAHRASFAVALRSALLVGNTVHLYAGLGIVPGSSAEREWEELEHKTAYWRDLFCNTQIVSTDGQPLCSNSSVTKA